MIDAYRATKWRDDGTMVAATKWRHGVAVGVSPWNRIQHHPVSPEGTTGNLTQPVHVAPSGLRVRFDLPNHRLAPVAKTCRPSGTHVLTPGRYVRAEEVEDDGVPFAEKMEGLTRELATQFHESEKLQSAMQISTQIGAADGQRTCVFHRKEYRAA